MSRKYSSWASNQLQNNSDLIMRKLTTIIGNEQDQLKNVERVEAIPHMYINVDAPPPMTRDDARVMQPTMISRQSSAYFPAPPGLPSSSNHTQTKIWPTEKSSKNSSAFESASSASKHPHKHKHRHHRHHHHHHHHNNRKHRAKSAESIRNRQHQAVISPTKMIITNPPSYIEQDPSQQQQQQQQPMIVYREVANGEGYTVDPNGLATVPYGLDNETGLVDDQQTPMIVYREQPSSINDGLTQQMFYNPEQETFVQQSDGFTCLPQQQSSQIVYCTDPNHQDYLCSSPHQNIIQQSISPSIQQQPQFVCLDNPQTTIQPTMINQIPVFNTLATNTTCPSVVNLSQPSIQRTASVVIQQPQAQPFQIIQQPSQLQMLQQPQPLQIIQQQPQQLQIIQTPQSQTGQLVQFAPSIAPQVLQTIQPPPPQVIQGQSVLQTIQMPTQAIAANPQILYQRPYDPIVMPIQNQPVAIAQQPLVALSQPSYAPSRILPTAIGGGGGVQSTAPNMFRHALLRTVADRTGVPVAGQTAGLQLMQPMASAPNLVLAAAGIQRSASLPIVPLTPGGLLIPFQPAPNRGLKAGPLPRTGGYPSTLRNFDDIHRQMQARYALLLQNFERQENNRVPSPPVLSAVAPRTVSTPYVSGNLSPGTGPYSRTLPTVLPYSQPSFIGSPSGSVTSSPYRPLRS